MTLTLGVSDFRVQDPRGPVYPLSTVRSLAAVSASQNSIVDGASPLAANDCVDIKIDASRIWQAGLSKADLKNGTSTIAGLHAVRYEVPFNVRIDGPTPEVANVRLTRGRPMKIRLRNEDGMAYPFQWRLELGDASHSGKGFVAAGDTTEIPITLASSNFSFLESGFLRTGDRTGLLTLSYHPDASFGVLPLPQKRYPVNAQLSFFGDTWQKITNYALVLVVLLAGIFVSLLINHALPLQKKRVEIKLRLAALEGRLAGLGGVVDSRILNLLRVEKKRLRERLSELQALVPQTAVDLPRLESRIEWLEKRIDLTQGAGELLAAVDTGSHRLALPEADEIRDHCREVLEIVGKHTASDEEIEEAKKHLSKAESVLEGADSNPSPIAIQDLIKRLERVRSVPSAELQKPAWQPFGRLFESLTTPPIPKPEDIDRDEFVRQAKLVCAADLVIEFARHVESSTSDEVRDKRMNRAPDLLKALEPGPDESIAEARELVRQVEQNVKQRDLVDEIKGCSDKGYGVIAGNSEPKRLMWIEVDPPTPVTYQLVTFRIRFERTALDCAAAQNEVHCKWLVRPHTDGAPWVDVELPGAPAERRVAGSRRQPTGWLIGYFFVAEREWTKIWNKATTLSGVGNALKQAAVKLKIRKADAVTEEEAETSYIIKAQFPELGKEIVSEPIVLEPRKVYVESRTVLGLVSLLITIL